MSMNRRRFLQLGTNAIASSSLLATRSQILSGQANLPLQLYSHEDQTVQWMTGRSDSSVRSGWAGRIADLLADQGYAPELSVNISIGGSNVWQSAGNVVPYALSP